MGIDVKDKQKNGDEDKTGKYTGGKGGDYTIVCNEPTQGAAGQGQHGHGDLPGQVQGHQPRLHHQRAGWGRCRRGAEGRGVKATIVSVDGGCNPGITSVKSGAIGATSQQYPVKMAQLGVEAIAKFKKTGEKPQVTPGLDFYDTGVALVTDKPVDGVESINTAEAEKHLLGQSIVTGQAATSRAGSGRTEASPGPRLAGYRTRPASDLHGKEAP